MEEIAISVIMPSLNVVPYIEECMESVVNQTLVNIEIICVDAGSTDGTLEILKKYKEKDNRIKIILSEKKSYGYQVNLGIKAAQGEFIGIVETDDWVAPNFYETLFSMVGKQKIDFVKMGYREFFDINDKRFFCNKVLNKTIEIANECIDLSRNRSMGVNELNHIWSGIYRRDFLINNCLWLNETAGASYQDTSFCILVGMMSEFCVYMKECLYNYRIDNPNSSVKTSSKWHCIIDEYKYIDSYFENYRKILQDKFVVVTEVKLITYMWNYLRLDEEKKRFFFDEIQKEMRDLMNNKQLFDELSETSKERCHLLTSLEKLKCYEEGEKIVYNTYKSIMKLALENKKFVVAGAGNYFGELCLLQNMLGVTFIKAVCDNSTMLQGCEVKGYLVESVENLAAKENNSYWIIANQKYGCEIKSQVCFWGIPEDRIILFNRILEHDKVLHIIREL